MISKLFELATDVPIVDFFLGINKFDHKPSMNVLTIKTLTFDYVMIIFAAECHHS